MRSKLKMSEHHFVFVHGAGHGGWCWYKLANSLRENGHKATCIDLKGAGINQTDPNTVTSLDDYDEPLYAFLSQLPIDQKVILVSHSVGGGSMTAAMCLFPSKVSLAVYVAAAMVKPGALIPDSLKNVMKICSGLIEKEAEKIWDFTFGNGPQNIPTSIIMKPEYVRDKFYNESPMEDYTLATTLLRPAPVMAFVGIMGIPEAPETEKIPRVYVKTGKDHMFQPHLQDLMLALWPPSKTFILQESDHSAFFSQPQELNQFLLQAASSLSS
ncbi:PREDICTED: methylesterase 18 [Camelina sativa]|uniref:Methylesterase 18 n=1 Tax=Camelina sativa TaxID=90675 RepID=A0ABM0VAU9_CAMSA|nr:PREDICTED: methylesterase 18 [Camelina sativa]